MVDNVGSSDLAPPPSSQTALLAIDNHRLQIIGGRDATGVNYYNTSVIYNTFHNMWQRNDTYPLPKSMAGFAAAIYTPDSDTACQWNIDISFRVCPVDELNRAQIYLNGGADAVDIFSNTSLY